MAPARRTERASAARPPHGCCGPATWPVRWRLAARLGRADPGHPARLRRRDRPGRDQPDPRRLQPRGAASAAQTLASRTAGSSTRRSGRSSTGPELDDFVRPDDASVACLRRQRQPDRNRATRADRWGPPTLGPRRPSATTRVATAADRAAKRRIDRLRPVRAQPRPRRLDRSTASGCFIAAGVLGGTLLASLAGLAIAGRAMRPIASLTATAREIADDRRPLPPHARARRPTTRSASWPGRSSRCCARSTPPAPSARRR